jgi:ATP-dependent DNA helicase RecQ
MIDESVADEDFKRLQRGKLDALLALAEAHDCRRVRLLAYFGEPSEPCGNCDNCLSPPATWDATEAARKLLSCIYRFHQHGGWRAPRAFGAVHLVDVLRGKRTDKVLHYGHEDLSTFGIGADLAESQWRGVIRQLVALGHLRAEGEFSTLVLTETSREVLRGAVPIRLRVPVEKVHRVRASKGRHGERVSARPGRGAVGADLESHDPALPLDQEQQACFAELKAWRAEVAREHNLPAYVVFHDATLKQMARERPTSLEALAGISGVGARKLERYGVEILRRLALA